jgi:predicted naringenin-chalcone synthase
MMLESSGPNILVENPTAGEFSTAAAVNSVVPHIAAVGVATPRRDVHQEFVRWAEPRLRSERDRRLFRRMSDRAGIEHRWSVLGDPGGFYAGDRAPSTKARMEAYAVEAPRLALQAVAALRQRVDLKAITHLVVASCTGFVAPGIDQILAAELGLSKDLERTLVGFMGCYAAVAALRTAAHIVRSAPDARVLVITVELSSLHLQEESELEPLLASLLFGDGAAAALVCASPGGFALSHFFSRCLPDSQDLIRWTIGDQGFAMYLSGEVPARIHEALSNVEHRRRLLCDVEPGELDAWAVHAGGRTILDAVETALGLGPEALDVSRGVLRDYGNMSSSTLMFILSRYLDRGAQAGLAVAFGPGLAAEGFQFRRAG